MREILFRGKTLNGNEWVIGAGVYKSEGYTWVITDDVTKTENRGTGSDAIIPETVGQYTGMTDKNGKKIFEGDILNCITSDFDGSDKYVYNFKITNITDFEQIGFLDFCNEIEIIGNIHDNPELLKEREG